MSERRQVRLQRKWEAHDREQIDGALSALLVAPNGRKLLWWLLEIGRVGSQPFTQNALATAFGCGELNVGQQILDRIISVDAAGYVRMMQEQADERAERNTALDSGDSDDPSDG